jgi:toluene monooxygenase system ferredoxin subunit
MWRRVCRPDEVPADSMKEFEADGGVRVLIANAGADYFAWQPLCPHEAVPLADGVHDCSVLTCLEHLWQFDLRTGAPLGDAETGLTGFRVKQEDGALHIWVEGA